MLLLPHQGNGFWNPSSKEDCVLHTPSCGDSEIMQSGKASDCAPVQGTLRKFESWEFRIWEACLTLNYDCLGPC